METAKADKALKGKSTVNMILPYFNSTAYMNSTKIRWVFATFKFGKDISISKAQESPFSMRYYYRRFLPVYESRSATDRNLDRL